ncbi:MAG: DNA integrity scanning protein DisA nucleotide-binding domain protein [Gemmataceae bacterium]
MAIPEQTVALLKSAKQICQDMPADAILLMVETAMDWDAIRARLPGCRLLVAAQGRALMQRLRETSGFELIELDNVPRPTAERMSVALLRAVADEQLQPGAHVVVLYNGIAAEQGRPEPVDSISVIHLGEHLERLSAGDLRKLETRVPLETLRLVVDMATELGREGRESKPVGALFVVGDTKRVLKMCRPINFNPFKGYSGEERDLRDRRVREQIKELAQLDGAFLIGRDGIAVAGCMYVDVEAEGITLSKGLGSRHWTAAAVSRKTEAIGVAVSQSSGTVRIFQDGEVVLHIEPLSRPHVWQQFYLESQEGEDGVTPAAIED